MHTEVRKVDCRAGGQGEAYGILESFLDEAGFKPSLVRNLAGDRPGNALYTEVPAPG